MLLFRSFSFLGSKFIINRYFLFRFFIFKVFDIIIKFLFFLLRTHIDSSFHRRSFPRSSTC